MTPFDLGLVAVIVLFAFWGLIRGLFRQIFGLLGFVGGLILARLWAAPFGQAFAKDWHWPPAVATAAAAFVIFLVAELAAKLVGGFLHRRLEGGFTGAVDRTGGFFLGGAKGALVAWALASLVALVQPHASHLERDTPAAKLKLPESRAVRWSSGTNLITEIAKK